MTERCSTDRRRFLRGVATGIVGGTSLLAGCETIASEYTGGAGVGVYLGNEAALPEWEEWFGRTVDYYSFNVPISGWEKYQIPNMPFERPIESIAADRDIAVTVKMFPPSETTMAAVANGDHAQQHRQFASSLINHGMASATVRLGHEMNGRWSPDTAVNRPEMFIRAWKQIVAAMDQHDDAAFSYMWPPHIGRQHMDPVTAYPGDEWVDEIGLTMYDQSGQYFPESCDDDCVSRLRRENWERLVNDEFGLNFWVDFAKKHGKPLSFPEYGVVNRSWNNSGGGDNAKFFDWFKQWVSRNRDIVGWHNVWCFVAGPHYVGPQSLHSDDQYSPHPDAAASFKSNFGPRWEL